MGGFWRGGEVQRTAAVRARRECPVSHPYKGRVVCDTRGSTGAAKGGYL